MSFERWKDYLSGVTFEVSSAKGYIFTQKLQQITQHIVTLQNGEKERATYVWQSRPMQVTAGLSSREQMT